MIGIFTNQQKTSSFPNQTSQLFVSQTNHVFKSGENRGLFTYAPISHRCFFVFCLVNELVCSLINTNHHVCFHANRTCRTCLVRTCTQVVQGRTYNNWFNLRKHTMFPTHFPPSDFISGCPGSIVLRHWNQPVTPTPPNAMRNGRLRARTLLNAINSAHFPPRCKFGLWPGGVLAVIT